MHRLFTDVIDGRGVSFTDEFKFEKYDQYIPYDNSLIKEHKSHTNDEVQNIIDDSNSEFLLWKTHSFDNEFTTLTKTSFLRNKNRLNIHCLK